MHFGFNELMWFAVLIVNFVILLAVYRFMGKTGLFVWMAIASILANIQVLKLVEFFGWNITLGNVLYGTSFLATDILSENYSKELARKSVWIGFFAMISMIILMTLSCLFHPATDDFVSEHMNAIFTVIPRVSAASLIAYLISQNHDVWAYHFWMKKFPDTKFIFIRNNLSTMISQLIDSAIFTTIAFAGMYPFKVLVQIIISTYVLKWLVAFFDTGCVYVAAHWFKAGKVREI
jgi:hypothetical protein